MTFKNLRYGLSSSVVLAASLFSVPSYAATDSIGLTVITTVEIGTCTATLVNDSDQDISVVDFGDVYISEINAKKLMADIDQKVTAGDVEGAKDLCRNTRGPVASICYQGLMHISESLDDIERSVSGYGTVQAANLEKGCSWIKLFIAMAPSLGFLGTVIGMVMSFDQIQQAGDISPTIVASGMKVALITTIFGIIVALILQVFYNYILSKVEHLTSQMEESAVTLMDIIAKSK